MKIFYSYSLNVWNVSYNCFVLTLQLRPIPSSSYVFTIIWDALKFLNSNWITAFMCTIKREEETFVYQARTFFKDSFESSEKRK